MAGMLVLLCAAAASAPSGQTQQVRVTARDFSFDMPARIPGGVIAFDFKNAGASRTTSASCASRRWTRAFDRAGGDGKERSSSVARSEWHRQNLVTEPFA